MAAVLKTVELKGSGGSNPSLSALCKSIKDAARKCSVFAYVPADVASSLAKGGGQGEKYVFRHRCSEV